MVAVKSGHSHATGAGIGAAFTVAFMTAKRSAGIIAGSSSSAVHLLKSHWHFSWPGIDSMSWGTQVDEEDQEFQEEFLGDKDPSILHFLLASGEEVQTRHLIHLNS